MNPEQTRLANRVSGRATYVCFAASNPRIATSASGTDLRCRSTRTSSFGRRIWYGRCQLWVANSRPPRRKPVAPEVRLAGGRLQAPTAGMDVRFGGLEMRQRPHRAEGGQVAGCSGHADPIVHRGVIDAASGTASNRVPHPGHHQRGRAIRSGDRPLGKRPVGHPRPVHQ